MDGKCSATNKSGEPCSATAWRDRLCRWHHPSLAEARAEGRRRGGQNKSARVRAAKRLPEGLLSTRDLQAVVGLSIMEVRSGKVEPAVANAVANLARAYIAVSEAGTLAERLAALEAQFGDRRVS